jgi:hypothetical protein
LPAAIFPLERHAWPHPQAGDAEKSGGQHDNAQQAKGSFPNSLPIVNVNCCSHLKAYPQKNCRSFAPRYSIAPKKL